MSIRTTAATTPFSPARCSSVTKPAKIKYRDLPQPVQRHARPAFAATAM